MQQQQSLVKRKSFTKHPIQRFWVGCVMVFMDRLTAEVLGQAGLVPMSADGQAWYLGPPRKTWCLGLQGGPGSWICSGGPGTCILWVVYSSWVYGGWPGAATFGVSLETGAVGLAWHWGGPATGVWVKWGTRFILFLSQEGHFSLNWAFWVWRRGDRSNVKLSFLPSSIHLFLFLCFTQVL